MQRMRCLVLMLLVACGGSDADPHAIGPCEGWLDNLGNPFTGQCEAACRTQPASTGEACDTVRVLNCAKFTFDGTDGCCVRDDDTIRFYECQ